MSVGGAADGGAETLLSESVNQSFCTILFELVMILKCFMVTQGDKSADPPPTRTSVFLA